ncbi:MAG: ATP-binding cassette domain-containing protein, partial [Acidaminococcaceae bacterium]|nr:ATP-binding cassette domain-containing protein [Acidaminococcaceae bacterium]
MMDINIQDLSVTFVTNQKKQTVLKNANLFLPQGKVTAIVGESGSGKSILGSAVAGLLDIRA